MVLTPPLPLVPKTKPVTLAKVLPVWTFALAKLVASPVPVTVKVCPATPVAVKLLPAKLVPAL